MTHTPTMSKFLHELPRHHLGQEKIGEKGAKGPSDHFLERNCVIVKGGCLKQKTLLPNGEGLMRKKDNPPVRVKQSCYISYIQV